MNYGAIRVGSCDRENVRWNVGRGRNDVSAEFGGEERLRPVVHRPLHGERVEVEEIVLPLAVGDEVKQRRVRRHDHDIGVAD